VQKRGGKIWAGKGVLLLNYHAMGGGKGEFGAGLPDGDSKESKKEDHNEGVNCAFLTQKRLFY